MSSKLLLQVAVVVTLLALVQQVSFSATAPSKRFDIDYATQLFGESMADKEAISLQKYLDGYRELMKFFHGLGAMYSFAATDLETHMGLLQNYHDTVKVDGKPVYLTIQSGVEFERDAYLSHNTSHPSAAEAFRWLHRSLEFVSAMMINLSQLSFDAAAGPTVIAAYDGTLAKYHPWAVRTIAKLVMRALPTKRELAEDALGKGQPIDEQVINGKVLKLGDVTKDLHGVVEQFFEEIDIDSIP